MHHKYIKHRDDLIWKEIAKARNEISPKCSANKVFVSFFPYQEQMRIILKGNKYYRIFKDLFEAKDTLLAAKKRDRQIYRQCGHQQAYHGNIERYNIMHV